MCDLIASEAALIDSLPVYQNVFFGWEQLFRTRLGGLDHRALRRAAAEALGKADVDGVDIDAPTGLRLERHIWVGDKGDYYEIADGVPQRGN